MRGPPRQPSQSLRSGSVSAMYAAPVGTSLLASTRMGGEQHAPQQLLSSLVVRAHHQAAWDAGFRWVLRDQTKRPAAVRLPNCTAPVPVCKG